MANRPRLLRPVGPPLGNYLRPGRNDHSILMALMAEGRADISGLVLDAALEERHAELRAEANTYGIETVLDPRVLELATDGGITRGGVAKLPWAGDTLPHTPELLTGSFGDALVEAIARQVALKRYSAVMAPVHYIDDPRSPWVAIDARLTRSLRRALNAAGLHDVCIYYPLAVPASILRHGLLRQQLLNTLNGLPIDGVWLRVHPFGTTSSGPLALRRYMESARDFHRLGVPVIGEHTGTIGVALLAFGAISGIESGITMGERYDVKGLLRPPTGGKAFAPSPRVYLTELGAFVTREQARQLFSNRQMRSLFACKVDGCCRRGATDMDADPRRHFVLRRSGEVSFYGRAPEPLRAGLYLEEFLRPATDYALRATRVLAEIEPARRRLEGWRNTLGAMYKQGLPTTVAVVPEGKRIQTRRQIGA